MRAIWFALYRKIAFSACVLFLSVGAVLSFYSRPALAEEDLSGKIASLEMKMEQIETEQKEIAMLNEKILATIDDLRVLAHRRPKLVNR